jgi:hypothetical protein
MYINTFSGEMRKDGIARQYLELYNRGITIKFIPRGSASTFDMVQLMNMLVQGSVLLQAATSFVLFIACYLHPKSALYYAAAYETLDYRLEMARFSGMAALLSSNWKSWLEHKGGNADMTQAELANVFQPACDEETANDLARTIFLQSDGDANGLLSVDQLVHLMTNDMCNWDKLSDHVEEQDMIEEYEKETGVKMRNRKGKSVLSRLKSHLHIGTPASASASPSQDTATDCDDEQKAASTIEYDDEHKSTLHPSKYTHSV